MTNTIQLKVTEQELVSILYALQDRSNAIRERINANESHGKLKEAHRVDIEIILKRQFKETTDALAQVEKTIEASYSYN
jgi:hypothetical protein